MPSVNIGGASTSNLTAVVNSGQVPVGGALVSIQQGETYVVPAGKVLAIRTVTAFMDTVNAGNLQNAALYINGETVFLSPASSMDNTPTSTDASTTNAGNMTIPVDLNFAAGESIAVTAVNRYSGSASGVAYGIVTGVLIDIAGSAAGNGSPSFAEPEPLVWWGTNALNVLNSSSQTARAIPLGDGKAIMIFGNTIDSTTMLLDIETGVQTAIYTGVESFNVSGYAYMHAAYQANYSSGKSMVRIAMGAIPAGSGLTTPGGCTSLVIDLMSGSADGDFRVRSLTRLIPTVVNGRSTVSGKKVMGFAGIDYLVTVDTSNVNSGAAQLNTGAVTVHNISGTVTVATIILAAQLDQTPLAAYRTTYVNDYFARVRAVRGQGGRLYLFMHTCNGNSTAPSVNTFEHLTVVVGPAGTLLGSLTTLGKVMDAAATTIAGQANVAPAIFGIADEAAGSDRTMALYAICLDTNGRARLHQTHFSHVAGGTPSIAVDNTNIPGTDTGYGALAHQLTWLPSTGLPSLAIEAPTATKLGSYFNKNDATDEEVGTENGQFMLQGATGQERRTNGVIYGNAAGWYYPTGAYVEKRSRTDFGTFVGNGVVDTVIDNPVQAIAAATKLLIVGVNGQWEIVTP